MSGSGIGGLCVSNICQAIIASIGYRWALRYIDMVNYKSAHIYTYQNWDRIVGIMCFVLIGVSSFLVKPLGSHKQTGGRSGLISWYLFKNKNFCIMFMHGLITTFGYMVTIKARAFCSNRMLTIFMLYLPI